MRGRSARAKARLGALLAAGVLGSLAGCAGAGPPPAATTQGGQIRDLYQVFLVGALAVTGLVWVLVAWSVIRFRRRRDESLPRQTASNVPVEIAYTVAPLAVVAVLFALTLRTQHDVDRLAARPAVVIEVSGFQWQWRFHYAREGITETGTLEHPAVMTVPVGTTVRLELRSSDVVHSFFVPRFLVKRDTVPGITNEIDLRVTQVGRFGGACAEFCGLEHARMTFTVRAVTPAVYARWAQGRGAGA